MQEILIVALGITLALKLIKIVDLIFGALTNLAEGHGLFNIDWRAKIIKYLPKVSMWIERTKKTWIYKLLDVIF